MEFYSLKLRRKVEIPAGKIKQVVKSGRTFAVGTYKVGNQEYQAWRVLGVNKGTKKKK